MLTAERLRKVLNYDAVSGEFTWLVSQGSVRAGAVAGNVKFYPRTGRTYVHIKIDRKLYSAHRLVWLYVHAEWPAQEIDHIDGDGLNNSLANLREATKSQNMCNQGANRRNTSGFKGVSWHNGDRKWRARIRLNNCYKFLGNFDSPEAAYAAYCKAAAELHGEYARVA